MKIIFSILSLGLFVSLARANDPSKITLVYQIEEKSFIIEGFEDRNPYYLQEGKKVFPPPEGHWAAEGNFDILVRKAYLPDLFQLIKLQRSHKQRHLPTRYQVDFPLFHHPPNVFASNDNSCLSWDTDDTNQLIILLSWVVGDSNYSSIASITGDDLKNVRLDRISQFQINEKALDGFPAIWILNAETLEIIEPKINKENRKAYLNWLVKVGSVKEFEDTWNAADRKLRFHEEMNPLHSVSLYRRQDILRAVPDLERWNKAEDLLGDSPSHYAARVGNTDFFNSLAKPKNSVNLFNDNGSGPIHIAIKNGHFNLSKFLIDTFGLKNRKKSNSSENPLMTAMNYRRYETFS